MSQPSQPGQPKPLPIGPDFDSDGESTDHDLAQVVDLEGLDTEELGRMARYHLTDRGFSTREVDLVRKTEGELVNAGRFAWDLFSELFDKKGG